MMNKQLWYQNLTLNGYNQPANPVDMGECKVDAPDDQYILRMLIKRPNDQFKIPSQLKWIEHVVDTCYAVQKSLNLANDRFVYVTVRNGIVKSTTDDMWHADGFSMRVPHVPEQNYVWSNHTSTEWLDQTFEIPSDFDPLEHNIHQYFDDHAEQKNVKQMPVGSLTMIDPYCIHRRPKLQEGTNRKFFRISFVPIEIEDDTCQQNPLLPTGPYNRDDIRKKLKRYV